ncbi:MAG: isoprenylcysteine carboxylmethyltransferase family protein [Burkholderiales bacterium]|nr:isoprenylcysteine carboxylmethyltransferase family protein [Burkholderiales bacterium]MCE7877858.1 isoprenylcysteine carboxylmethyltransferase family protein [Betaproteobacteria bacterium PRO3]
MGGWFSLLYGSVVYVLFLGTFLYAIGFVGNIVVPKGIDAGAPGPLATALIVNLHLLAFFAVQHSVMARPAFKRMWTRIVPQALERSTYVLAASLALCLLFWQWRPIVSPVIWNVEGSGAAIVIRAVFWLGFVVALVSTFLINHFELFGLRQVWADLRGRTIPAPEFRTPLFYRHVRHPLYVGLILVFWAAPVMTAGHLLFAAMTTACILVGIWFEERDLIAQFGDRYRRYRERTGMLVPRFGSAAPTTGGDNARSKVPR